jgi:hypothetical protein
VKYTESDRLNTKVLELLTALEAQDKFRIKIWNKSTNAVIYDNQLGTPDGADPTTIIGGGSIIIHR